MRVPPRNQPRTMPRRPPQRPKKRYRLMPSGSTSRAGGAQGPEQPDQALPRRSRPIDDHLEPKPFKKPAHCLPTARELVGGQRPSRHLTMSHPDDRLGVVVEALVVEKVPTRWIETVLLKKPFTPNPITLRDRVKNSLTRDHPQIHPRMICPKRQRSPINPTSSRKLSRSISQPPADTACSQFPPSASPSTPGRVHTPTGASTCSRAPRPIRTPPTTLPQTVIFAARPTRTSESHKPAPSGQSDTGPASFAQTSIEEAQRRSTALQELRKEH